MNISKKTIIILLLGGILEWYDFSLFGSLTPVISKIFFSKETAAIASLLLFSIFASGFLLRPIGGLFFGHIGDVYGRKKTISATIFLMAFSTGMIGILPTQANIGMLSPLLLIMLRMIQGLASSGEYPGSMCFLVETAPNKRQGLYGSLSILGAAGGIFLGTFTAFIFSSFLSNEQMLAWGWRVLFLLGLPLGLLGWYFRKQLRESEVFETAMSSIEKIKIPFKEIIEKEKSNLIRGIVLFSLPTALFCIGFIYIASYMANIKVITMQESLIDNALGVLSYGIFLPIFGYLSDIFDPKKIMLLGSILLLIFLYPTALLFASLKNEYILLGQGILGLLMAMSSAPIPIIVSKMFSTLTRYSGIALSVGLGSSIFGGTAPVIISYINKTTFTPFHFIFYPLLLSFLFLIVIISLNKQNFLWRFQDECH